MLDDNEVDDLLENLPKLRYLTDWEREFVNSVTMQWEDRRSLTQDQRKKLDQIWEERSR